MTKEITITKTYDLAKPAEVVAMANVLKHYVVKQGLFTNIKGKNYAHVDGWQFAGFLTGLNAVVEEPKNLSTDKETKWSDEAIIYQGEKIVGRGFALCSNKEFSKKGFDEYAVLSMAQTRAIGKAYRNKIGWVMKLAGYESTPSEEMGKAGDIQKEKFTSPQNITPTQTKKATTAIRKPTDYVAQVKARLVKLGAKTEIQAIKILKEKTGLTWKDFRSVTPKQAQIALAALIQSK
jgi:hypothetical protein